MSDFNTFFKADNRSARRVDVRSKILVLFVTSVAVFFVDIRGLSLLFVLFIALVIIDGCIEFKDRPHEFATVIKAVLKVAIPLYVICIFSFLVNAIVITGDGPSSIAGFVADGNEAPTTYNLKPTTFNGDGPCVTSESFSRGAFYVERILLLGWSSLFVANTVSLIEFANVFKWMFWPLRKLKIPVQDASLAVSIALRFIPEIFIEFQNIRCAQWCRGAKMSSGSLVARTRAHAGCFVPLIVRMMANVDSLSDALCVRCYGVTDVSPKEDMDDVSSVQVVFSAIVCFFVVLVAALV